MARGRRALCAAACTGLLCAVLPGSAAADTVAVKVRDNFFDPENIHIDVGDKVKWDTSGLNAHTVTSDKKGLFDSGSISGGETFSRTFKKEGRVAYFCKFHGGRGGVGMAGVVVVGDPGPPGGGGPDDNGDDRIVVPKERPTIQKAVNSAKPGSTIVVRPGIYKESVTVTTSNLTIKGVDRFRTVVTGSDTKVNGFFVDSTKNVTIKNLTVRNFTSSGIYFNASTDFLAARIDSIKNRTYGVYAFDSYDGVFRDSFGYGSGDAAFYVGQCLECGTLIDHVTAKTNYIGYSGTNATGVTVRDSAFVNNGVGVMPNTFPSEELGPNRSTLIIGNRVRDNNYTSVPASGFSESYGLPFGTGVWLLGVRNNTVRNNVIEDHERYGVLVTAGLDGNDPPKNNEVIFNFIRSSGVYDLAWDGAGSDNCFEDNDITGATGPPNMQDMYACSKRPFDGIPFEPVRQDVHDAVFNSGEREQVEPPEPNRPQCQAGKPGCRR